jgi:uncharacterized protein (TIGR03435 family)
MPLSSIEPELLVSSIITYGGGATRMPTPTVFQAVKDQLGLKLQAGKSDVEFLVIDRVSRTPTEN